MSQDIAVRKANQGDIEEIYALDKNTFVEAWTREALLTDIESNKQAIMLVAEYKSEFAGYADIWVIAGEADLNSIAVAGSFRRLGVGAALIKRMIELLDSLDTEIINLEVRVSNTPAINLYKKYGFYECGIRPKYYLDNGEDALIMKREKGNNA